MSADEHIAHWLPTNCRLSKAGAIGAKCVAARRSSLQTPRPPTRKHDRNQGKCPLDGDPGLR